MFSLCVDLSLASDDYLTINPLTHEPLSPGAHSEEIKTKKEGGNKHEQNSTANDTGNRPGGCGENGKLRC